MKFTTIALSLLIATFSFAKDCDCNGDDGFEWTNNRYKNPSKGGCVSNGAYIDERVFIARTAMVCGDNFIEGEDIKIIGNALLTGTAEISGSNIMIGRDARVGGTAVINSNVKVIQKTIMSGTHANVEYNGIKDDKAAQIAHQQHLKKLAEQKAAEEARKARMKEIDKLQNRLVSHRKGGKKLYDFYFPATCEIASYNTDGSTERVNLERSTVRSWYDNDLAKYVEMRFKNNYPQKSLGIEFRYNTSKNFLNNTLIPLLKRVYRECQALN